jgi:hypothetical protein
MKLIIKSNSNTLYAVQLPNYTDVDHDIPHILEEVKWAMPDGEVLETYSLHSDQLTDFERKQLDIHGEIVTPLVMLDLGA